MSESTFARFPHNSASGRDHNPHAANAARKRIAELPDPYMEHASPAKEELVGEVDPVSPAAEAAVGQGKAPKQAEIAAAKAKAEMPVSAPVAAATATSAAPGATNPLATPAEVPVADAASTGPQPPKPRQSLPSRLRPFLIGIGTFIVLYFIFKPELLISQIDYLTHKKTPAITATQASTVVSANPTISIPKISVNAPVVYATDNSESAILVDLESGVVHYANTALPGQPGNSVIFGHSSNDWWEPGNYKFVFVLLDKLVPGDTFSVNYNSKQYIYQVTSSTVVDPTDVAVLNQTADPEMTLITCSPPGTSWKRLIVVAKQISPAPKTTTPVPAVATKPGTGTLPSNSKSLTDEVSSAWTSVKNFLSGGSTQQAPPSEAPTSGASTIPATQ